MAEPSSIPGFYTARQAAQKLGVSEARIRKLAGIYGWETRIVGLAKLFSAADLNRYSADLERFRRHLDSAQNNSFFE